MIDRRDINTEGGDYRETKNDGYYAERDLIVYPPTPPESRDRAESLLLAAVKNEVAGRLAQSLHNRVYIELHKEEDPSQVIQPWAVDVKLGSQPSERCPEGTNIVEIFDKPEIGGKLLILGAPGSGKTMMLLQLADELVQRAGANAAYPVPVLLNLSAWKPEFKDIPSWMVADLKLKYGVRQDIAKKWIEEGRILPLLDGLDELMSERQETCVRALNEFLPAWSGVPLVVCSRREEYQNYEANLGLNGAVILQPLTDGQIEKFLRGAGCEWLWEAVQQDIDVMGWKGRYLFPSQLLREKLREAGFELLSELWLKYIDEEEKEKSAFFESICSHLNLMEKVELERYRLVMNRFMDSMEGLARSPLLLTILVLASGGLPVEMWQKTESAEERRQILFEAYIAERLKRRYLGGKNLPATKHGQKPYKDDEKTKAWLGWLALRLIEENQTEFFIEKLQPRFLTTQGQKIVYRLVIGIVFGLVIGTVGGLVFGLVIGTVGGLVFGLVIGMVGWSDSIKTVETIKFSWYFFKRGLRVGFLFWEIACLFLFLFGGLVFGLIGGRPGELFGGLVFGLIGGLVAVRLFGRLFGRWLFLFLMFSGLIGWLSLDLELSGWLFFGLFVGLVYEVVFEQFCRKSFFENIFSKLYFLSLAIVAVYLILYEVYVGHLEFLFREYSNQPFYIIIYMLLYMISDMMPFLLSIYELVLFASVIAVVGGLVVGIVESFTGEEVDAKTRDNQGIHQSIFNSVIFGLMFIPFGMAIPIAMHYFNKPLILNTALAQGGAIGFLFGIIISGGLISAIKHYSLRITLWLFGYNPLNYSKYLRYCTERGFLQRVGGGYRFVHAFLRDHCIAQYTPHQLNRAIVEKRNYWQRKKTPTNQNYWQRKKTPTNRNYWQRDKTSTNQNYWQRKKKPLVSRIFRHWLNVILDYPRSKGSRKQIFEWRKNKDTTKKPIK